MSTLLEMHITYRMTKDEKKNMKINSGEVENDKPIKVCNAYILIH